MERLKQAIAKGGWNNYSLARSLGVSEGTIRFWRRGRIPRGDRLQRLSQLLGVAPNWLLYGEEQYAPTLKGDALLLAEEFAKYGEDGIRFGRESLKLLKQARGGHQQGEDSSIRKGKTKEKRDKHRAA